MSDVDSPQWNDNLERDLNNFSALTKKIEEGIKKRISSLDQQYDSLKQNHPIIQIFDSKITLDVGGELFRTTVEVITSEESLFTSMFSGRILVEPDPYDGSFFIDRSPQYFRYVLEYLRYTKIRGLKNIDKFDKEGLLAEAYFYELQGLVELLGGKKKSGNKTFEHEKDWDDNGVLHYLRAQDKKNGPKILITSGGGSTNANYIITSSGSCEYNISQEKASEILGTKVEWTLCSPTQTGQNVLIVDLGKEHMLSVTACLFHCNYSPSTYFSNCTLFGSNDNTTYTSIMKVALGLNKVPKDVTPYRYFKIDQEGYQTLCSGWELYGSL